MCSAGSLQTSLWRSCLIRTLGVHRLHAAPPKRFAGLRVLHRGCAPRHPPRTLCSLMRWLLLDLFSLCGDFALFLCFNSWRVSPRSAKLKEYCIELSKCGSPVTLRAGEWKPRWLCMDNARRSCIDLEVDRDASHAERTYLCSLERR